MNVRAVFLKCRIGGEGVKLPFFLLEEVTVFFSPAAREKNSLLFCFFFFLEGFVKGRINVFFFVLQVLFFF